MPGAWAEQRASSTRNLAISGPRATDVGGTLRTVRRDDHVDLNTLTRIPREDWRDRPFVVRVCPDGGASGPRGIASLPVGLTPNDPVTIWGVVVIMLTVPAAAYLPSRRATQIDPAVTLRNECNGPSSRWQVSLNVRQLGPDWRMAEAADTLGHAA
jgi:hypothetical protein